MLKMVRKSGKDGDGGYVIRVKKGSRKEMSLMQMDVKHLLQVYKDLH